MPAGRTPPVGTPVARLSDAASYSSRVLALNGRQLSTGLHGGITRYTTEVLRRLPEFDVLAPPSAVASGVVGHTWEQLALPALVRRRSLWSPANFGPLAIRRQVVTVYDVSPIDHPEWFTPAYRKLFATVVPALVRRVARVLTISEFSRDRIAAVARVSPASIGLAQPGVGAPFLDPRPPFEERGTEILVLAGPDPRKNASTVLAAWRQIESVLPDHHVSVISSQRPSSVFAPSPLDDVPRVRVLTHVDDADLVERLRNAALAVFAPLYEGFGLPALEAVACRTPLVVSDREPLRTVLARSGAVFVDPLNATALGEAIVALATTSTPTDPAVASAYSWDTAASVTLAALREIEG